MKFILLKQNQDPTACIFDSLPKKYVKSIKTCYMKDKYKGYKIFCKSKKEDDIGFNLIDFMINTSIAVNDDVIVAKVDENDILIDLANDQEINEIIQDWRLYKDDSSMKWKNTCVGCGMDMGWEWSSQTCSRACVYQIEDEIEYFEDIENKSNSTRKRKREETSNDVEPEKKKLKVV